MLTWEHVCIYDSMHGHALLFHLYNLKINSLGVYKFSNLRNLQSS